MRVVLLSRMKLLKNISSWSKLEIHTFVEVVDEKEAVDVYQEIKIVCDV